MARQSLREHIVRAGLQVMLRSGYHGSSVRDIVAAAGVPQGSFTNHFRSKEDFAVAVLEHYFAHIETLMQQSLADATLAPRARLERYLTLITGRLEDDHWERGCLIGDLSLEVPAQNDHLRQQLQDMYTVWLVPFTECIAAAQVAGEVTNHFTPEDLAEFLLASWQGAILRMKVERNPAALIRFRHIAFATVFAPAAA